MMGEGIIDDKNLGFVPLTTQKFDFSEK